MLEHKIQNSYWLILTVLTLYPSQLLLPVATFTLDVSTISSAGLGSVISNGPTNTASGFAGNLNTFKLLGDINNDGWPDYAVAALYEANSDGAVYVLFGGPNSVADFTLGDNMIATNRGFKIKGTLNSGEVLGHSLAGEFDWNNDTIADFAISGNPSGGTGRVYIILGKETGWGDVYINTLVGSGAIRINGETNTNFGFTISHAGDMNKDNYDDLIVTAANDNTEAGSAYVLFGGTSTTGFTVNNAMGPTKGFKMNGMDTTTPGKLGVKCAYAGDVNSDGYSDILIAAPYESGTGNTYLLFGGPTATLVTLNVQVSMAASRGIRIAGIGTDSLCGWGVRAAGDINGDYIDDFIVGALQESPAGAAYVIYGRPLGTAWTSFSLSTVPGSTKGFKLSGYKAASSFGQSVGPTMDLNRDGYNDIIIGAPDDDPSGNGAAYVIFGNSTNYLTDITVGPTISPIRGYKIINSGGGLNFGLAITYLKDINNDTYNEIAIAAPNDGTGKLYIISRPMKCTPGQYEDWKTLTCPTCMDLCTTCNNGTTCATCKHANYTLTSGICELDCPAHCANCTDTNTCTKCGYDNYTLTADSKCALNCSEHCISCVNNTYCLECESSLYNLTNATCELIPPPPPPIPIPEPEEEKSMVEVGEALSSTTTVATSLVNAQVLLVSAGVAIINYNNLSKMLQYIRYLAIKYPTNLQNILDYLMPKKPGMFESIQDEVTQQLHGYFSEASLPPTLTEVDPYFIVNFWSNLLYLVVILSAIGVLSGLERLSRGIPLLNKLIMKVVGSLRWVFLLVAVCDYFTDVSFFTVIQLRHLNIQSTAEVLNFLSIILSNIILLFALIIFFYITLDINSKRHHEQESELRKAREGWEEKWKEIRLVFEDLAPNSMVQISCTLLICIRTYLFGMIIGGFTEIPVFQCTLILSLSVLMTLYLVFCRPMEELLHFISCLIDELILLCVNISLIWMAILDAKNDYNNDVRDKLVMVIILLNVVLISKFIIFSVINGIIAAVKIIKMIRLKLANGKKIATTISTDSPIDNTNIKQAERKPQIKIFAKGDESQDYMMLQGRTFINIKGQYSPNISSLTSATTSTYPFEHSERYSSTQELTRTELKTQNEDRKLLKIVVENTKENMTNEDQNTSNLSIPDLPKTENIVTNNDHYEKNDNNNIPDNNGDDSVSISSQNDRLESLSPSPVHTQLITQSFVPSKVFEDVKIFLDPCPPDLDPSPTQFERNSDRNFNKIHPFKISED